MLHKKGCIDGQTLAFAAKKKLRSSCEHGNRVIVYDPHLDVIAIDARKFMLFGN
jgi:hypothetical protein